MLDKIIAISFLSYIVLLSSSCISRTVTQKVFIEDNAKLFTVTQTKTLDSLLKSHESKTTNEIVVTTTDHYDPHPDIQSYALNYLRKNGLGKKDLDNGTVIVLSAPNREVWVGTGYGTEQILKDEIAKRIIDSIMIPHFAKGEYYAGILAGTKEITRFMEVDSNKILPIHSQTSRNYR